MKALQQKTFILFAGMFSGFNLMPFTSSPKSLSDLFGSLKSDNLFADANGFQTDANKLMNDWNIIKNDLMTSFNSLENDTNTSKA